MKCEENGECTGGKEVACWTGHIMEKWTVPLGLEMLPLGTKNMKGIFSVYVWVCMFL